MMKLLPHAIENAYSQRAGVPMPCTVDPVQMYEGKADIHAS